MRTRVHDLSEERGILLRAQGAVAVTAWSWCRGVVVSWCCRQKVREFANVYQHHRRPSKIGFTMHKCLALQHQKQASNSCLLDLSAAANSACMFRRICSPEVWCAADASRASTSTTLKAWIWHHGFMTMSRSKELYSCCCKDATEHAEY
jgi:hypothetical protein